MWHSCRPSSKEHNLLGIECPSIHNYDIPPEGTAIQPKEQELKDDQESEMVPQDTSDSEHKQQDPVNQQICHSPIEVT
jgi:hypothetical protein